MLVLGSSSLKAASHFACRGAEEARRAVGRNRFYGYQRWLAEWSPSLSRHLVKEKATDVSGLILP